MDRDVWTSASTNGYCVEVKWASGCNSAANCVEVGHREGRVLVRDSKNPDLEPLSFQRSLWINTVIAPVMLGRIPGGVYEVAGGFEWRGHTTDGDTQRFTFTPEEWAEFQDGARRGLFTPELEEE